MVKVYYLDILFFINLAINYLVLFVTAKLSASFIKALRILVAAIFGALGCIGFFYIKVPTGLLVFLQLTFYSAVVFLAFGKSSFMRYIKRFILFLVSNFTLAGGIFAIYFFLSPQNIVVRNGSLYIDIPFHILLFWVLVAYVLVSVALFGLKTIGDHCIKEIEIDLLGEQIKTTAFKDTGKNLIDPLTNKPLIIIEKELVKHFFSLDNIPDDAFVRMFPYRTVGGETQTLLGVKADKILIGKKNIGSAYIALASTKLSDDNTYRALL